MMLSIQIAKFKFLHYQMRAVMPNLMFAKVTSSTVVYDSMTLTYTELGHAVKIHN